MKKMLALLPLSISMGAMAANPPPNTLDMNSAFSAPTTAQEAFSAVGMLDLPHEYNQAVVPNVKSVIANQIQEYENQQLSPQQIKRLQAIELEKQRVLSTPYSNVPAPVVRSINPDLSAGKTPPVIRVSKNLLTSIVFTDLDGNPWYIDRVVLNREQFNDSASVDPEGAPTNILTLEPTQAIQYGSVSVMLKGQPVPVIFLLASGQPEVDVRVDARMSGQNPDMPKEGINPASLMSASGVDESSLGFLDGVIPSGAEQLQSSDGAVKAWSFNNQTYVKTRLDVLYPSFQSKASTSDGTHIYRFQKNPKTISFMQRGGQPVTASLTEMPYVYQN